MAARFVRLVGTAEQVADVDSCPEDRKAGEKSGNGSYLSLGLEGFCRLKAP